MTHRTMPTLPLEIILVIIQNVVSSDGQKDTIAYPASHSVTRTLFSCLTICKATTLPAEEQLYQHCLNIDSKRRLRSLVQSYHRPHGVIDDCPRIQDRISLGRSIFLSPFTSETINEPSVINDLHELFTLLSGTIKKLVIDMPLRTAYPIDPDDSDSEDPEFVDYAGGAAAPELRPRLRAAFRALTAVEEFVSVRDELYVDTRMPSDRTLDPTVWATWSHLRHLALYNVDVNPGFREDVLSLPLLEKLVLARPDGDDDELDENLFDLDKHLEVVIVNTREELQRHLDFMTYEVQGHAWLRFTRDVDARLSGTPVPTPSGTVALKLAVVEGAGRNNPIDACQEWVKERSLNGTLWQ